MALCFTQGRDKYHLVLNHKICFIPLGMPENTS